MKDGLAARERLADCPPDADAWRLLLRHLFDHPSARRLVNPLRLDNDQVSRLRFHFNCCRLENPFETSLQPARMTTVEGISEPESGVLALEGIRTRSVGATPPRYPSASSSAGSGSRLGVLAKPLACVAGLALLERAVATFCSRGLEQIVVVVGHGSASVREFVARRGLDVELVHAGGGRPTEAFAAFCGQLSVGWHFLAPADPEAKGAVERLQGFMETSFEPGRSFAGPFGYQGQIATRGTRRKATYWSALRGDSFGRWQRR